MDDKREYQIPIMFDVEAIDADEAARAVVKILAGHQVPGNTMDGATVESWWTIEQAAKVHDGNDNEHGVVVFEYDLDYLYDLLTATQAGAQQPERHARLLDYFDRTNGRQGNTSYPPVEDDDEPENAPTYKIVRRYASDEWPNEVMVEGLSLAEAKEHCADPETSSRTATGRDAMALTVERGDWFDSLTAE